MVSSDYRWQIPRTCILDANGGYRCWHDRFVKLVAWYDNEAGYTSKTLDLVAYVAGRDQEVGV